MRRRLVLTLAITAGFGLVAAGGGAWLWSWPDPPPGTLDFDALATAGDPAPLAPYPTRDDARLQHRLYTADSDPDTVVIALHGSASDSRYLAPLARSLAGDGLAHVSTPDLRGHGPAPERRGDVDYIGQLEDDLADLRDHLVAELDAENVVVLGHSSGGGLAVRAAGSDRVDGIDGWVLLAPYLGHDAPTALDQDSGWVNPNVGRIALLDMARSVGLDVAQDSDVVRFAMPQERRDGYETLTYTYRMNVSFGTEDHAGDLAAMTQPTLTLVGADDESFDATAYEPTLVDAGHSPDSVHLLSGVGHLDLVSDEAAHTAIAEFLRTETAGG